MRPAEIALPSPAPVPALVPQGAIEARYEPPPPQPPIVAETTVVPHAEPPPPEPSLNERLARRASSLVGRRSLKDVSRAVPDDCSGFVRLVYEAEGVGLTDLSYSDGAVRALYRRSKASGALRRHAEPGDLVFFRETYDRNRDGLRNDGLTHIGIVETVDEDGTVGFVHRARTGVVRARMNTLRPRSARANGKAINDVLRRRSAKFRAYLAGELFAGFASAERLRSPAVAAARRPESRKRPQRK
jgi:hypothetical protein